MPNILFQTGYGHYTTPAKRFNSIVTGGASITIGNFGRNNTNGLRISSGGGAVDTTMYARTLLAATASTLYCAFGFKMSKEPTSNNDTVVQLWDTGSMQNALIVQSNGTIRIVRANTSTTIATSTVGLFPNVWYHIEWKTVIHSSVGSTEVRLNEVSIIDVSGVNTKGTSNGYATDFSLGGTLIFTDGIVFDYDDTIIRSDTWSGDLQVKHFFPTGVGSTNAWAITGATFSYQALSDSDPNDNTDYISTSNVGDTSLLTFGSLPSTTTIHAIVTLPWAEKTDAGTAKFASVSKIGTTSYTGADQAPSNGSYTYFPEVLQTSPATGLTWTTTEFNSIEIGVTRTA